MKQDKHIVWGDLNLNYEDWRSDLEAEYPDKTEDERYMIMHEINAEYLNDERVNLDIQLSIPILVCADLGLWNGRKSGYKLIDSGNIKDCLYSSCDYNEWFVDKRGDLRCTAVHHDGINHYLYRAIRDTATDAQIDRLQEKIYNGTATRTDITRVTRRLGDDIAAVYGFSVSQPKQQTMER